MDRVLVVDDEPRHRRGLVNMIHSLRPEYIVIEAKNGQEALGLVENQSAAIVITDIKMPVLDGLDFLQAINEIKIDTKVIILSGYAYFEYAQTALKLGAFDFVLKPVNKEKVEQMLIKVENKIAQEQQASIRKGIIECQRDSLLSEYQESQFNKWIINYLDSGEKTELVKQFDLQNNGTVIVGKICKLTDVPIVEGEHKSYAIKKCISNGLQTVLPSCCKEISFLLSDETEQMFFSIITCTIALDDAIIKEAILQFEDKLYESHGMKITVGIGPIYENISKKIPECYRQAFQEVGKRLSNLYGYEESDTIKKCKAFIDVHYADEISLETLAEKFYFNISYFCSLFRNSTGVKFTEYLRKVRLAKAAELLRTGDLRIFEIAKSVGYQNEKYFYRVFRMGYKLTPEEYRRNNASL